MIFKEKDLPRVSRNADSRYRAAGKSDLSGDTLNHSADETEEFGHSDGVRILDAVTALNSTVVALVGRTIAVGRGDREGGEDKGGESGENGELHL